ncbi:hypothetical protein DID88_004160 [Monilinia fructigena]|uniref:Uncharacterized protein n=1 Tax=Monilinia fructigena TaxID=38457 RepID=A0A395IRX9_9HELO|nr:hypothetical protein DID88_004160 [Monilinia fructigena]
MTTLGATLPDMSYRTMVNDLPRARAPQPFMYQMQFANQGILSPPTASSYTTPYQTQYGVYPANQQMQQQHMHMVTNNPQFYAGQGIWDNRNHNKQDRIIIYNLVALDSKVKSLQENQIGVQYPQRGQAGGPNALPAQRNHLWSEDLHESLVKVGTRL